MLGCLRGFGWLNSSCLDRPLAFVGVVRLLYRVAARLTTLYLISRDNSSVTERAIQSGAPIPTLKRSDIFCASTEKGLGLQVSCRAVACTGGGSSTPLSLASAPPYTSDMQGLVWGEFPKDVFSFCCADSEALFCSLPSLCSMYRCHKYV